MSTTETRDATWLESEVETSAGTVRFREAGSGPTLLFVHGALVDGHLWTATAEKLTDRFRCVLPDLPFGSHVTPMNEDANLTFPGMGRLVSEIAGILSPEGVTLVGNDSGGTACQLLMTGDPALTEGIRGVVLTNTDAFDNFPPGRFKVLFGLAKLRPFMWSLSQSLRSEAMCRSPLGYQPLAKTRLPSELIDRWTRPIISSAGVRRDFTDLVRSVDTKLTNEAARKMPGFDRPVVIAWGDEDPFFPVDHADRLADALPEGRVVRIPDAKTFVMLDQPQRLADEIAAFAGEL